MISASYHAMCDVRNNARPPGHGINTPTLCQHFHNYKKTRLLTFSKMEYCLTMATLFIRHPRMSLQQLGI